MKLKISSKLMAAFTVAIIPFFIVTGFGYYTLVSISEETSKLTFHIDELSSINAITFSIVQLEDPVHDFLMTGNNDLIVKYNRLLVKLRRDLKNLINLKYMTNFKRGFFLEIEKKIEELDALNQKSFSLKRPLTTSVSMKVTMEHSNKINSILKIIEKFQDIFRNKLQSMKQNVEKNQKYIYNLLMLSWVGSIVFCVLVVFFISSNFSRTITAIDNAAKSIGSGNLNMRIDFKSFDELGDLVNTFNDMAGKLQKTTVSKDYFDNIIQTMNDVLIVLSLNGVIQSVNETATKILGYSKDEMIGKKAEDIFPREHPLRDMKLMDQINKGEIIQKEALCINREGKKIPMVVSLSKLHDEPGSTKGIVCVAQDISFQKKAEKDIKHLSQEMIRIQEEERGRMSMEIHDNLGGSLLALKINIHSLLSRKGGINDSLKNEYKNIMDYLNSIIESSRNLSRNISPAGFKSVGLNRAITELANNFNKNNGMKISINLSNITGFFPDDWDINIYRIVQEALTNIIKHSGADSVEITAKPFRNKLVIQIKDNGRGINFDLLKKLESKDTGLGLLIMRERASLLGGEFKIASLVNKGTVIKVEIPRNKNC